jgi:hypothetical protein
MLELLFREAEAHVRFKGVVSDLTAKTEAAKSCEAYP